MESPLNVTTHYTSQQDIRRIAQLILDRARSVHCSIMTSDRYSALCQIMEMVGESDDTSGDRKMTYTLVTSGIRYLTEVFVEEIKRGYNISAFLTNAYLNLDHLRAVLPHKQFEEFSELLHITAGVPHFQSQSGAVLNPTVMYRILSLFYLILDTVITLFKDVNIVGYTDSYHMNSGRHNSKFLEIENRLYDPTIIYNINVTGMYYVNKRPITRDTTIATIATISTNTTTKSSRKRVNDGVGDIEPQKITILKRSKDEAGGIVDNINTITKNVVDIPSRSVSSLTTKLTELSLRDPKVEEVD